MEMPSMEIGGTNTSADELFHSSRCIGERILSIKQYLLRNSIINASSIASGNLWARKSILVDPRFISVSRMDSVTGAQNAPHLVGDFFSFIAPCFAYQRGGVKMWMENTDSTERITSNVINTNGFFTNTPISTSFAAYTNYFGNFVPLAGPGGVYPITACNVQDLQSGIFQHLPYYSRLPFALNTYYNNVDNSGSDPSRPFAAWYVSRNTSNFSSVVLGRSVSDDFQLSFFTGCPPLARSYT